MTEQEQIFWVLKNGKSEHQKLIESLRNHLNHKLDEYERNEKKVSVDNIISSLQYIIDDIEDDYLCRDEDDYYNWGTYDSEDTI